MSILRRTGIALIAVGLFDIAFLVYGYFANISHASTFNLHSVLAGILLMRGGLRTASLVRWIAVLLLSVCSVWLCYLPFQQPLDLTLTELRLETAQTLVTYAWMFFVPAFAAWVAWQLGRAPVLAARAVAGRPVRNMTIPAMIGLALTAAGVTFSWFLINGELADRAKALALDKVGPGYRFHVTSIRFRSVPRGSFGSALVVAWKADEIRTVRVRWEDK